MGGGLSLLGQNVNLNDVLSVLDVVVSTIEHSDVTGGIGGYSVLASTADHRNANNEPDPLGMAGGFAGDIEGGHIQDSSSHEFVYIIGQVSAGGYVGTMQPGAVANVLGDGSVLKKLVNLDNLLSLVQDFVPTIRNSSTDAAVCVYAADARGIGYALRPVVFAVGVLLLPCCGVVAPDMAAAVTTCIAAGHAAACGCIRCRLCAHRAAAHCGIG